MHQLLDRDGMLTVGTEEKDIDWEAMWRSQLARDDKDSARNGVLHQSARNYGSSRQPTPHATQHSGGRNVQQAGVLYAWICQLGKSAARGMSQM